MTGRHRNLPPADDVARFRELDAWRKARAAETPSAAMRRILESAGAVGRLRTPSVVGTAAPRPTAPTGRVALAVSAASEDEATSPPTSP